MVDEDEWADGYLVEGVKVDTSGFLTSTIDAHLDAALPRAMSNPTPGPHHGVAGRPRPHGVPIIDAWRSGVSSYPKRWLVAMVEAGMDLRPRERLEMLAARDDVLLLHRDLVDNVQGSLMRSSD